MNFTDAIGQSHPPVDRGGMPPRIVSLVPSITELLCDLGLTHWLVGRTGFCIHPDGTVRGIPKVGGTKDVNMDKVRALAPTHVIVNIDENTKPCADRLATFVPNVVVTHPLAPSDNPALYRLLGGIFGAEERAEALCAAFGQERAALRGLAAHPQTVLYCIWKDPWMTVSADTYIANMLAEIGWRCWAPGAAAEAGRPAARYPEFDWGDPTLATVDQVLLSSEPYRFGEKHVDALERQTGKVVRLVDGEMCSWYGSRAVEGLRYLRRLALEG